MASKTCLNEVPEAGGRCPASFRVDLGEDGKLRVVDLAVHVHGDELLCRLLDLSEELLHRGGLPGPGEPPAYGVQGPGPLQPRPHLEGELLHLVLAVLELLGDIVQLEDLRFTEEGLVPHEEAFLHPNRDSIGFYLNLDHAQRDDEPHHGFMHRLQRLLPVRSRESFSWFLVMERPHPSHCTSPSAMGGLSGAGFASCFASREGGAAEPFLDSGVPAAGGVPFPSGGFVAGPVPLVPGLTLTVLGCSSRAGAAGASCRASAWTGSGDLGMASVGALAWAG